MVFLVLAFGQVDLDYHAIGSPETFVCFGPEAGLRISIYRLCLDVKRLASVYSVAVIVRRTSGSFPINDLNTM